MTTRIPSPTELRSRIIVRPLVAGDLGKLSELYGRVDDLYPDGAKKLQIRLEHAAAYHQGAHVAVALNSPSIPLALSSEARKSGMSLKLCTFWVAPDVRRLGVGRALLASRVDAWVRNSNSSVHVTVRKTELLPLQSLLRKFGFKSIALELRRYGDERDEVVLQWKPEWLPVELQLSDPASALVG